VWDAMTGTQIENRDVFEGVPDRVALIPTPRGWCFFGGIPWLVGKYVGLERGVV